MLCCKNTKNSNFIFLENSDGPPVQSAKMEKLDKGKEKLEKSDKKTEFSNKEKADLLKNYQETQERIDAAKEKLNDCKKIMETLPKDSESKQKAEQLYAEAAKLLDGIVENLPKTIYDASDINWVLSKVRAEEETQLLDVLEKNGLTELKTDDLSNIRKIEKDPAKIINSYKEFIAIGLTQNEATMALSSVCKNTIDNKYAGLKTYLQESKGLGVTFLDSINLWEANTDKPLEVLKTMKQAGVKDDFSSMLILCKGDLSKITEILKCKDILLKKGVADFYTGMFFILSRTEKLGLAAMTSFVVGAIDLGLDDSEALMLWSNLPKALNGAEILAAVSKMKSAGIKKHFASIYKTVDQADYARVATLTDSLNPGISKDMIIAISKLDGQPKDLSAYFNSIKNETGDDGRQICKLYLIQKDLNVITTYIKSLKESGLPASSLFEFYFSDKNPEKLKELSTAAKKLEDAGLNKLDAFRLTRQMAEEGRSGTSLEAEIAIIITLIKKLGPKSLENSAIVNVWRLYSHSPDRVPDDILSRKFFTSDPKKTVPFAEALVKTGLNSETVFGWWEVSHDPDDVLNFFQLTNDCTSIQGKSVSIKDQIDIANFYCNQNPETKAFLKYVMDHSTSIGLEPLKSFLNDPALQISLDVYKMIGSKDVAQALKIGRNLYIDGFRGNPDKTTIDAKIKEIEELQKETDSLKIFEGRNVLFFANGEEWSGGRKRFGSIETKEGLLKSVGPKGSLSCKMPSTPTPTEAELKQIKEETLAGITNTSSPFTFYFRGHGGPENIAVINGQMEDGIPKFTGENSTIGIEEMAQAIAKRREKFPGTEAALAKDMFIFGCCISKNFVDAVSIRIKELNGVQPIGMASAEHGQSSVSDPNGKGEVGDAILKVGDSGITLKDVRKNEANYFTSDFTLYVPGKSGNLKQIADSKPVPQSKGVQSGQT